MIDADESSGDDQEDEVEMQVKEPQPSAVRKQSGDYIQETAVAAQTLQQNNGNHFYNC